MLSNGEIALADSNVDLSTASLAELMIAQLYVLPQTIQATDTVTLGVDVRNDGSAESGAFTVRFTLDNGETHEVEFPSIAPGGSHWEEWMHEPLNPGEHLLSVQLDVLDQVREGNKYDNTASLPFQITGALALDSLTANDAAGMELDNDEASSSDDDDETLTSDDSGKKKKKGKDKPKVTDLGTIEVKVPVEHIPPGKVSAQEIHDHLADLNTWIGKYWNAYRQGLLDFQRTMDHATFDEKKEDKIQGILKSVGIALFDKVLETVGEVPGPWGLVAKGVKAASHAWLDHQDQVEKKAAEDKKAKGEILFAEYLKSFSDPSAMQENKMTAAVMAEEMPLAQELARIMKEDDDGPATPDGVVLGEAAKFLRELKERVEAFHAALPLPSAFELDFAERFASTPGWTRHGDGFGRPFAMYFNLKLRRDLEWTLVEASPTWKLVTDSSKAEALAKEIQDKLKEKGKKPWQADEMLKVVEIEFDDSLVGYKWRGSVKFARTSPYDPEYGIPVAGGWLDEVEKAWARPEIRNVVLQNERIEGSND